MINIRISKIYIIFVISVIVHLYTKHLIKRKPSVHLSALEWQKGQKMISRPFWIVDFKHTDIFFFSFFFFFSVPRANCDDKLQRPHAHKTQRETTITKSDDDDDEGRGPPGGTVATVTCSASDLWGTARLLLCRQCASNTSCSLPGTHHGTGTTRTFPPFPVVCAYI